MNDASDLVARPATPDGGRDPAAGIASINGVPLHGSGCSPGATELRQRACTELLRQAAQRAGMLDAGDVAATDGSISEAAADAIERLLDSALAIPAADDAACRRHFAAHATRFASGERVRLRHILFAVTDGVDVVALRRRAETALLDVRCAGPECDAFATAARELSNCPSGAAGGDLGWLGAADCAPEFAREIFGKSERGVLPRLVHSRFGLHVVEVLERVPGVMPAYEDVSAAVARALHRQAYATALHQYLRVLASSARVEGVDLAVSDSPLVQ